MKKETFTKLIKPFIEPLITSQTVSHNEAVHDQSNKDCIEFIANRLQDLGFTCVIQPVPEARNKFNLIARLERGQGGVWLCGHSDTVSADPHHWDSDPWRLVESEDNSWRGLGVCDMKGFIAQIMALASQERLDQWKKSLTVIVTADEETTMAGARALKQEKIDRPDLVLIGEPTKNRPIVAHKGFLALSVIFNGEGGHSSQAGLLPDALMACHDFMRSLYELRQQWQKQYHCPEFEIAWPTINPSCLKAGDSINRICSKATLDIDIRTTPGMHLTEIVDVLNKILERCGKRHGVEASLISSGESIPSFCCVKDISDIERASGYKKTSASYCTEAPFFSEYCPRVVVMGPGRIEQAHQANETLYFDDLWQSTQIYKNIFDECKR